MIAIDTSKMLLFEWHCLPSDTVTVFLILILILKGGREVILYLSDPKFLSPE